MTHLNVLQDPPRTGLDEIEIASPCDVPWDSLRGDDRVRACGKCRENVYNISAMTRVEALRLIRSHEGRVCVRIHRRPDGTVVTGDCWSRLRAARKRGLLVFVGVLFVVGCLQLVAMVVGLRGLRNLVGGHRMGEVPTQVLPPPAPRADDAELPDVVPVEPPTTVKMGEVAPVREPRLMGKIIAKPKKPRPAKKIVLDKGLID